MPISNNKGLIYTIKNENNIWNIKYSNNEAKDTYIELPLFYYSGYKVISSSNTINKLVNEDGYVRINISNISGHISFKYTGTIFFRVGQVITSGTMFCIFTYIVGRYIIIKKLKNKT